MAAMEQDTIVAISTPVGRGGIGVVRLSGPRAREVVAPLLRLRHELAAGRARFGVVVDVAGGKRAKVDPYGMTNKIAGGREAKADPCGMTNKIAAGKEAQTDPYGMTNGAVLDEAVVTYFAAPNSYTGEDVVEIAAHGSPVLLEYLVRQCCAGGARLAEPGEFTQRAFLAGRIDLTQAEAVDDLIGSSTLEQARVAARQMGGVLAKVVAPVKASLVELIATMEAGIDFAEDDIDVMAAEKIVAKIAEVRAPLEALERSFAYGRVVRDGFRMAIVGRPNAGKSSLFNRLVERERAIVTATPGTTRDLVTERVSMEGIPVELIDTAGLREGTDEAERMGIAKSREAMADADVVLLVVDATIGMGDEDRAVMGRSEVLVAWNKSDLVGASFIPPLTMKPRRMGYPNDLVGEEDEGGRALLDNPPFAENAKDGPPSLGTGSGMVRTSALTGEGIADLRAAIVGAVAGADGGLREAGMLTNMRQHQAVEQAVRGLDAARAAAGSGIPHEMVLLDLYEAVRGLDALTGVTTSEDVLRLIFSKFCIGK
jgi:tRNA modification GTPase